MKMGIYKITNVINGKFYIGSSNDIDVRWRNHKRQLDMNHHRNPKLQNSWNFYGRDKFEFLVIEDMTDRLILLDDINREIELLGREQFYLDTFKSYLRDIGYNICPIACGGDNITHNPNRNAFIEKMSTLSSGENNPMFGRSHSEESKKLQRNRARGRFSLEWFVEKYGEDVGKDRYNNRNRFLKTRKINYSYPNVCRGNHAYKHSDEIKKKMSDSRKRLALVKDELIADIKSDKFTMKNISQKYNIAFSSIKYYKQKIRNGSI